MSERELIQKDLIEFLNENNLNQSYGIIDAHKGKYRSITFAKAAITDAEIKIFSEKYLILKWQTASRNVPMVGQEKFTSVPDLKEFIKKNFA